MGFDRKYQIAADEEMERFSKELTKELQVYSAQGLEEEVDNFLTKVKDSMEQYVPVDTSATRDSWFQEVQSEKGRVVGIFGHDKEGQLDYVPFIYLGLHPERGEISFRDGKIPFWLQPSVNENLDYLKSVLSKPRGN